MLPLSDCLLAIGYGTCTIMVLMACICAGFLLLSFLTLACLFICGCILFI
jgi:hypothetical protein